MKYVSKSVNDTAGIAEHILKKEMRKKRIGALVFGLQGDLGAGKTAFVKEAARFLRAKETITSPTFVILKIYNIQDTRYKNFVHIDAYRLESAEDLNQLNWEDTVKNSQNIIFIEWPERVEEALPRDVIKINFEFIDENIRKIELQ